MNGKEAFRTSLNVSNLFVTGYLDDITPDEMMIRPVPGANHIAWQLGHLILAERHFVNVAVPDSMPELPAGFADQYGRGKSPTDNPADYLTKEEYLAMMTQVREATLRALNGLTDEDFDKPIHGNVPPFVKSVGDCFATIGPHWACHAGQWVVLRRKLGRPVMF